MPESKKLNPQIHEVPIGTRELRNIKIYPLAAGHQLEMTDLISDAIAAFMEMSGEDKTDEEKNEDMIKFISFIIGLIRKNISKIITYISDEDESILNEISNDQLADITIIVYKENFEGPVKKVLALFQKEEKNTSPLLRRPVQRSAKHMDTS